MVSVRNVLLSWSSGKDSAWSLHVLRRREDVRVVGLLTTINQAADRVAMHAVRRTLLQAQAEVVDLPLWDVLLPSPCSNSDYERIMGGFCEQAVRRGINAIAFGDLFLAEVRRYRERQLESTGLEPLFPLWGLPTRSLALEMIASGLRAKITCIDPRVLPRSFAGREFDERFLADLPANTDPCGENGEFHSFVYAAPVFREPLSICAGEIVERDGFVFADFLPAAKTDAPRSR
jgi:uncharacterized protein (TIGR00290 family)